MFTDQKNRMRNSIMADTSDTSRVAASFNSYLPTNAEESNASILNTTMTSKLVLQEQDLNTAPVYASKWNMEPKSPRKSISTYHDRFLPSSKSKTQIITSANQTTTDLLTKFSLSSLKQPVTIVRNISSSPERVLDAPTIVDDYYFNIIDWSSSNVIAVALSSTVYSWDAGSGDINMITCVDPQEATGELISCVKWIPGSNSLCISTNTGEMHIYDAPTGKRIRSLRGRQERVGSLSWENNTLSSGAMDNSIWHHDIRQKYHKIGESNTHKGEVCGLAWRTDGRFLASGGNDNLVALWDSRVLSRPVQQLQEHEAAVKALAWCPWQMNSLATGGGTADRRIHLWNTNSGTVQNTIEANAQVSSLHWNSNTNEIVAALAYPSNSIGIWSHPSMTKLAEIEQAHDERVLNSALSPDENMLVTCGADENIKFWRLSNKTNTRRGPLNKMEITRI